MLRTHQIPKDYICFMTKKIMSEPVKAADGDTYEREAIEEWFQAHDTSPRTKQKLEHKKLVVNQGILSNIARFLADASGSYDEVLYLPKSWVRECIIAIKRNQLQAVQRWLDKDKRLLTLNLENDSTVLHLACEFSSPKLVDIILDVLKQRNKAIIPEGVALKPIHLNVLLERALKDRDYPKCTLLLKLGAEIEQPEILTQNTLLHRMVIEGNEKAVDWLLEQKAALEGANSEGNTPLLLSVMQRNIGLTEFLLKKKANLEVKNAKKKTPFYVALENNNNEMENLLLRYGANPAFICGLTQLSALHIVVRRGDVKMLSELLQTKAIAIIDAQDLQGNTPLHLAVELEHEDVIFLLLKARAYHKIKNLQGETPLDLAKKKPKIANFILQILRELKKAKLKEADELRQLALQQASKIAELEAIFKSQAQSFSTQFIGMQRAIKQEESKNENLNACMQMMETQMRLLQPIVQEAATFDSPRLIFTPASLGNPACFHLNPDPHATLEATRFLRLVAEGEQNHAEVMLQSNPTLALIPNVVTDLSGRIFTGMTGFQYAVWALDWHMWVMIRKYLPDNAALEQAQGFEIGSWIEAHGVHCNLNILLHAYQVTLSLYDAQKYDEGNNAWIEQVGRAQLLLPAHVINQYCHPTRAFYPIPNFKDELLLPRSRIIDEGEWFTARYAGGKLGERFAVYRGEHRGSADHHGLGCVASNEWGEGCASGRAIVYDCDSVRALKVVRITQREELINELRLRHTQKKTA